MEDEDWKKEISSIPPLKSKKEYVFSSVGGSKDILIGKGVEIKSKYFKNNNVENLHFLDLGIEKSIKDKIKNKTLKIESKFDMHGLTIDEAFNKLVSFIEESYNRRKRIVLVVTGKGVKRDAFNSSIRENLVKWINSPLLQKYVQAFDYAMQQEGGEGAFYILIKKIS